MKNKNLTHIFTIENITRFVLVSIMISYSSYVYGLSIILTVFSMVIAMTIVGYCLAQLYDGLKMFVKTKIWKLSKIKTLIYSFLVVITTLFSCVFLPVYVVKWGFSSALVILIVLLIIDVIIGISRK